MTMDDRGSGCLAFQQIGETRRAGTIEELVLDGLPHVGIEQQHLLSRERKGDGGVVGNRRFAFAEQRASDQQRTQPAGMRGHVNCGAQCAERFGASGARIIEQRASFRDASNVALEGRVFSIGEEGMFASMGSGAPPCSCSPTRTVSSMCSRTKAEETPKNRPAINPIARYSGGFGTRRLGRRESRIGESDVRGAQSRLYVESPSAFRKAHHIAGGWRPLPATATAASPNSHSGRRRRAPGA